MCAKSICEMLKKISKFTIVYKKLIINFLTHLPDTKEKSEAFGSSLLLSNSPLSPKVVNGSFAAIFDADEFLAKTYAGIRIAVSKMQVCSRLPTNTGHLPQTAPGVAFDATPCTRHTHVGQTVLAGLAHGCRCGAHHPGRWRGQLMRCALRCSWQPGGWRPGKHTGRCRQ